MDKQVKPNSVLFLELFTEIEQKLKEICKDEFHSTFSELLRKAEKHSDVVYHFASDLKEFAQLRNAIVHTRRQNFIIAEPHDEVIAEMKKIHRLLYNPPKVFTVMTKNPVFTTPDDLLVDLITNFSTKRIRRCPVVEKGSIVGMVTARTITNWLASIKDTEISIKSIKIRDVLEFTDKDEFIVVAKNSDILSLIGQFRNSLKQGRYIQAALVTDNGSIKSNLIGIVTPSDLPRLIEKVNYAD